MAFTSKVVMLLLVSSLGWWQASAVGDYAKIIIQDLKNITTMTKALTTEVDRISKSNVGVNGPQVVDGIENITEAFVRANSSLNTVSGRVSLSDENAIVVALYLVVDAQVKLKLALVADKNFMFLERYARSIESALLRLREIAVTKTESYGPHLLRELRKAPASSSLTKTFARILLKRLDDSLSTAITKYA